MPRHSQVRWDTLFLLGILSPSCGLLPVGRSKGRCPVGNPNLMSPAKGSVPSKGEMFLPRAWPWKIPQLNQSSQMKPFKCPQKKKERKKTERLVLEQKGFFLNISPTTYYPLICNFDKQQIGFRCIRGATAWTQALIKHSGESYKPASPPGECVNPDIPKRGISRGVLCWCCFSGFLHSFGVLWKVKPLASHNALS